MDLEYLEVISTLNLRTEISRLSAEDEQTFLDMAHKSKAIHAPWVFSAMEPAAFKELLARNTQDNFETVVLRTKGTQDIVGIFNLSQIFYHNFQNTILGCYANIAYSGQGLMREGLLQTVAYALFKLKLHRIEANIICENQRSLNFFKKFGFRHEGMSKNYLNVNGAWRDHDKFALTREDWDYVVSQHRQAM